MSDGSSVLWFMEPQDFNEINKLTVLDDNGPVVNINELEYIHGLILANIYLSNKAILIDPESGKVIARIDLQNLADRVAKEGVKKFADGIAYDQEHDRLYMTGKRWPLLFEVKLVERENGKRFQWHP